MQRGRLVYFQTRLMSQIWWFMRSVVRRRFLLQYVCLAICLLVLFLLTQAFRFVSRGPICFCTKTGKVLNVDTNLKNIQPHNSMLIKPGERLVAWNSIVSENSFGGLPRATYGETREGIMNLLQEFIDLLQQHEIEFFMSQGMLLGSYFFHDIIPWDDDIDLMVHIRDVNKLRAMFRKAEFRTVYGCHSFHDPVNMYGDEVLGEDIPANNTKSCGQENPYQVCYQQGKIYRHTSPHAGGYTWRYPFIDFIFYASNATHMYNHELWFNGKIEIPLENFYPFHLRPYNRLWVPAPRMPMQYLHSKFKNEFECKQGHWNHSRETSAYWRDPHRANCTEIGDCYAHVRRRPLTTEEKLQLFSISESKTAITGENDQAVNNNAPKIRNNAPNIGNNSLKVYSNAPRAGAAVRPELEPRQSSKPKDSQSRNKGGFDTKMLSNSFNNTSTNEGSNKSDNVYSIEETAKKRGEHTEAGEQTGFNRSRLGVVEELVLAGQVIQSVVLEEEYESPYDLSLEKK